MIDKKKTFQDDELLYGDYEKVSLIAKSCSETFYDNLKPRRHILPNNV